MRSLLGVNVLIALPVVAIAERLEAAAAEPQHEFWPDEVSILDRRTVDARRPEGTPAGDPSAATAKA